MIIYPPTYGMCCRICGQIVPVGTPIGVDEDGSDFVEHVDCFVKKVVKEAFDAAFNATGANDGK